MSTGSSDVSNTKKRKISIESSDANDTKHTKHSASTKPRCYPAEINRSYQIKYAKSQNQLQRTLTEDLTLSIFACAVKTTALIKLYTHIYQKSNKNTNKQPIYLFIYPENIKAIKLRNKQSRSEKPYYSLHFSMTKEPCLIFKERVIESKTRTKACLDMMQRLAGLKEFSLEIDNLSALTPAIKDLELFTSAFLPDRIKTRPRTDGERADIRKLYAGTKGEIIDSTQAASHIEASPPTYTESTYKTSRASSEHISHLIIQICGAFQVN
jgi:hypothetical protein